MLRLRKKAKGFTLVELLIVVAIIGIIAAIAIPNLLNAIQRGKQKRTMADIRSVGEANEIYQVDFNQVVKVDIFAAANRTYLEPDYIKKMVLKDGWNNPLVYNVDATGGEYTIGAGGKDGTYVANSCHDDTALQRQLGQTAHFSDDMQFSNGQFTCHPEGKQI